MEKVRKEGVTAHPVFAVGPGQSEQGGQEVRPGQRKAVAPEVEVEVAFNCSLDMRPPRVARKRG